MRLHLDLDDDLMSEFDHHIAEGDRIRFIETALRTALAAHVRRLGLAQAIGSIPDSGHDWDDDPAGWVRRQRSGHRVDR